MVTSLRDMWAMNAPPMAPGWFKPVMTTERPEPIPQFAYHGAARTQEELDAHTQAMSKRNEETSTWDWEYRRQVQIQWPYAWADLMLTERRS